MSNTGHLYNTRLEIQKIAQKLFSYETMTKFYYKLVFKRKINLEKPIYFNEKINWLKLFSYQYRDDIIQCSDKYMVRNYIEEKGLGVYLNDLIGVWDDWSQVNWDSLPNQFAMKANHGARYNIICEDKSQISQKETGKKMKKWLSEDFSLYYAEAHYSKIKPRIIAEEFLGGDIIDYKFFCFNGEPKFFYVAKGFGKGQNERMAFFNMDGTKADFYRTSYEQLNEEIGLPEKFEEMIEISKKLAQDFPFVRIDLFFVKGKIYFSEMTFTPDRGLMTIQPEKYYKIWGDYLELPTLK